jgi:hypothetical protein
MEPYPTLQGLTDLGMAGGSSGVGTKRRRRTNTNPNSTSSQPSQGQGQTQSHSLGHVHPPPPALMGMTMSMGGGGGSLSDGGSCVTLTVLLRFSLLSDAKASGLEMKSVARKKLYQEIISTLENDHPVWSEELSTFSIS